MQSEQLNFVGRLKWSVLDKDTGDVVKSGAGKNVVVNLGKYALCTYIAGGAAFQLDTMKVGNTVAPSFTAASLDLGNIVSTATPSVSSSTNVITADGTFAFGASYTITEAGIYAGATPWALTAAINEAVTTSQLLQVVWEIELA